MNPRVEQALRDEMDSYLDFLRDTRETEREVKAFTARTAAARAALAHIDQLRKSSGATESDAAGLAGALLDAARGEMATDRKSVV